MISYFRLNLIFIQQCLISNDFHYRQSNSYTSVFSVTTYVFYLINRLCLSGDRF